MGSGGDGRVPQADLALRDRRRQRPGTEPSDAARSPHGGASRALGRVRLERDRDRWSRHGTRAWCACRRAQAHRRTVGHPRAHTQGQRRLVSRKRAQLARQGAQKGRRDGSRHPRARSAVGARASRVSHRDSSTSRHRTPREGRPARSAKLYARRADRHARSVRRRAGATRRCGLARRRTRRRREEFDLQRQIRSGASGAVLSVLHRGAGHDRRRDGPCGARRDSVSRPRLRRS